MSLVVLLLHSFPLQDKTRLQKWVNNMRRGEWTPSRHQYLCSEHFTEDCFDIRWGIRYLKNTAIPTLFPSVENVCSNLHEKKMFKENLFEFTDVLTLQLYIFSILNPQQIHVLYCCELTAVLFFTQGM